MDHVYGNRVVRKIEVGSTADDAHRQAASFIADTLIVVQRIRPARWLLAGGSTPARLYELIARENRIDWSRLHLYWGDERAVPPDHEDSNYSMVNKTLLRHTSIPAENVHRIPAERGPQLAAEDYARHVRNTAPSMDLALLGIGVDAHTASLFPDAPSLEETEQPFVACKGPGHPRITATLGLINQSQSVVFLATGPQKAEAVALAIEQAPSSRHPASLIAPKSGSICWFLDSAAASALKHGIRSSST